ncbi:LOW QUALITY PROTEIN: carbonyl reductase family member 4 [Scleropages formosus]|uniref:LOW QUALITY PROTEIN: carbonyl reductase family member 4 n=1 Tax=Scleropages formosus TaxID=113540 RepID=UPI0010FA9556|nr:LOW QUALITY PROTEIN: carbonyl reductase family member 4-like [Scleropages formosus]
MSKKLCAVFGGSRGIGRSVARLLAERGRGAAVVSPGLECAQATARCLVLACAPSVLLLVDRQSPPLTAADHGALSCDVSDELRVRRTFERLRQRSGGIRYLVNAAGVDRDALLFGARTEDMVDLLHTNLLGTVLTCRAALRSMLRKPGGAIVNVGSVVGLKGNAGQGIYSATKAALEGFACSLAKEVAARNIRVNLVAPGFIRTDMTTALGEEHPKVAIPLGGFGEPSQVAHAVLFLLQTPYVTGQVLVVDDGMQLVM